MLPRFADNPTGDVWLWMPFAPLETALLFVVGYIIAAHAAVLAGAVLPWCRRCCLPCACGRCCGPTHKWILRVTATGTMDACLSATTIYFYAASGTQSQPTSRAIDS
jgi:hypothetical protein